MNQPCEPVLAIRDLGRLRYAPAFEVQQQTHEAVKQRQAPPTLLLVEHEPVITVSQRRSAPDHIVADRETLERLGIEVQPTNRGGDITYHGPGQLVAYPILRLDDLRMNLGRYVRWLEQILIDTLEHFGIRGVRDPAATGVWIERNRWRAADAVPADQPPAPEAKIAAIGVRVSRHVTLHGVALNVSTDLMHFRTIVPCGLVGRPVISMRRLLGDDCPSMPTVKEVLADVMHERMRQATDAAQVADGD